MTCNYHEYRELTDKLFYGVPLFGEHMNDAVETLRQYIVDGGAAYITDALHIGMMEVSKEDAPGKVIKRRFVFIGGPRNGEELDIHEMENIGLFLIGGPYENRYKEPLNGGTVL